MQANIAFVADHDLDPRSPEQPFVFIQSGTVVEIPENDQRIAANESWGPPIWARMYHPETNEVLLYDRGKKKLKAFTEMQQERRTGYSWHGTWPKALLEKDHPAWQKKWAPDQNVLK